MPHFKFLDDLIRELSTTEEFVTLLKVVHNQP